MLLLLLAVTALKQKQVKLHRIRVAEQGRRRDDNDFYGMTSSVYRASWPRQPLQCQTQRPSKRIR